MNSPISQSWLELPEMGVGITFSSAIEPILRHQADLVDVIEVEPQTTWLDTGADSNRYRQPEEVARHIRELPFNKLVHSIGVPVGGSNNHDPNQTTLLRDIIQDLGSPWASEHLNFNSTEAFQTGFFLPPRQSEQGVDVVVDSIRRLRDELGIHLAVETGVNYLASRPDEMADGDFVAAVATQADSGILLDLHNIHTNALNGRQPVDAFIDQLPLERVWEVHLAGGFWMDGYWLDAHSGPIPDALFTQSREIVARLPNLKAIIFEIYPSFVESVGLDEICWQLERLRELWTLRGSRRDPAGQRDAGAHAPEPRPVEQRDEDTVTPVAWQTELGSLVIGKPPEQELGRELANDEGLALLQKLSLEFRASMITSNLRRTTRLLILALGEPVYRAILAEYRKNVTPNLFAATEARAFAGFIQGLDINVPQLAEVIEFEIAILETLIDGETRLVRFEFDPLPMLLALGEGTLPDEPGRAGLFEIEITPDNAQSIF
ncbi:DUF692 domain-containing protein [Granulosicoccus sp. 3-233]|uniref:DUF692 domain-containing protein n=1 Tax=Granulosicoccus sp. 3-233 TaxID=3417969 RepID=UPI003D33948E